MLLAVAVAIAALGLSGPAVRAEDPITAQAMVSGLAYPSMFTVAPDGKVLWSELHTGVIGQFDPATGARTVAAQVTALCTDGDEGLFGIALDPGYPKVRTLYAYATRAVDGVCQQQVLRLNPDGTVAVLWSERYTGEHIGGRLVIGPDRQLWFATGEGGDAAHAQDPASGHGKVLRLTLGGAVPADNPFPGSPVYASGFRNVFGFDFDPSSGRLWATDNGPECNDEINLVTAGGNYGWGPTATCTTPPEAPANTNQDGVDPRQPAFWYSPSAGTTGVAFCAGCGLGTQVEGRLLYGVWYFGDIRALTLSDDRTQVIGDTLVYHHFTGEAPLDLENGPDGAVWFSDKTAIYRLAVNGPPPVITISDAAGNEGSSTKKPSLSVVVHLSSASASPVTVHYATVDGTADGTDYVARAGTVTFAPGQTSVRVAISLRPDTVREADETFSVVLSSPSGATFGDDTAVVTIRNDD
jgi:glucose/arabinose dehydrogenase